MYGGSYAINFLNTTLEFVLYTQSIENRTSFRQNATYILFHKQWQQVED
jgi:hypothetical protein